MKLHHAVVVLSYGEFRKAKAFATAELAKAFADGVIVGAEAMGDRDNVICFLLDERGSLAVSNDALTAARAAGWERA